MERLQQVPEVLNSSIHKIQELELTASKKENQLDSIRYYEFVVPLVKAVQEQQKMIEELKKEIEALKKQQNK